jgi:hypothetical protein
MAKATTDPQAMLVWALSAFDDNKVAESLEHLRHYLKWRLNGGMEPKRIHAKRGVEEMDGDRLADELLTMIQFKSELIWPATYAELY